MNLSLDSDEPVLIHGAHEGNITWEKFLQNQKIIEDNRFTFAAGCKGAIRNGSALLQGIVRCGMCLVQLKTHYVGAGGKVYYRCVNKAERFGKYACLTISAQRLDRIVTDALLEAVSPAQLQLTLRELEELAKENRPDAHREQEEQEIAKVEMNEAQLRFDSIDPRNTLVFREYERKLQEKMVAVKQLEKRLAKSSKTSGRDLTAAAFRSLLGLPQDLRAFWQCAAVTNADRKQALRCLIRQVTIKRRNNSDYQDVNIHWMIGVITTYTTVKNGRRSDPGAVDLMRRLAPDHTISQIVDSLHEAGFKPAFGCERFTRNSVQRSLKAYGIKLACPEKSSSDGKPRGDGRYSAPAVAKMLNVTDKMVHRWCNDGTLDGVRRVPTGNYWVKISPEQVSALKKP